MCERCKTIDRIIRELKDEQADLKCSRARRSRYFADYYAANRDKKLAAANARHAAQRQTGI